MSINRGIAKLWYIYTLEYYTAMNRMNYHVVAEFHRYCVEQKKPGHHAISYHLHEVQEQEKQVNGGRCQRIDYPWMVVVVVVGI